MKAAGVVCLTISLLLLPLQSAQSIQAANDPLSGLISGKTFERGKKESSAKYELYKYEGYRSEGCSVQWNETHQVIENGKQTFLTIQTLTVLLGTIDSTSLSNSKYEAGRVVSFTTVGMEPRIKASVKTVYEDLSEDSSTGFASGYGFYFSSDVDAAKLLVELKSRIRSCKS